MGNVCSSVRGKAAGERPVVVDACGMQVRSAYVCRCVWHAGSFGIHVSMRVACRFVRHTCVDARACIRRVRVCVCVGGGGGRTWLKGRIT